MKSQLRNLAVVGIVAIGAIAMPAQSPAPANFAPPVIAESITPASPWPDAPEPASSSSLLSSSASSAFIMPVPPRQPKLNIGKKALSLFAWPGYGICADSRNEDEQGLKIMLAVERGTAFFDGASTYIMLDTPYLPNAIRATEADPLLTIFGNRNKVGVLATGSFLEVLVNGGSVAIPRMVQRKMGERAGHIARVGVLFVDGTLSMVHIQLAIFNLTNTARLMQSVNAVKGN
jgi:hypothetical protein